VEAKRGSWAVQFEWSGEEGEGRSMRLKPPTSVFVPCLGEEHPPLIR